MSDELIFRSCGRRAMMRDAALILGAGLTMLHAPFAAQAATTGAAEGSLDLTAYKGKVVYLDFWASWCAPCKLSFHFMEGLRQRYGEHDLAIVTVNVDRQRGAAQAFLQKNDVDLPVVYDPAGTLAAHYKVAAMPTSFLFDRSGQVRFVHRGYFDAKTEEYDQHVAALVDRQS